MRPAPRGLPGVNDWFDEISHGLVLLEPFSLADLGAAIAIYRRAVGEHARAFEREAARALGATALSLRADHRRFEESLAQLDWHLAIVRHEDHGGHRQALGQYGRVLAEAMRRHLRAEDDALRVAAGARAGQR